MTDLKKLPELYEDGLVQTLENFLNLASGRLAGEEEQYTAQQDADCQLAFDSMVKDLHRRRAEREQAWGKKFPAWLGEKPSKPEKSAKGKKPPKSDPVERAVTRRKTKNPAKGHPPT